MLPAAIVLYRRLEHNISAVGQLRRVRSEGSTMAEESGVDRFIKNVVSPYTNHSYWPSFTAKLKSNLTPHLQQPMESSVVR